MSKYTPNPQTVEEAIGNVQFQLDNVEGYHSMGALDAAAIKAQCLWDAARVLLRMLDRQKQKSDQPIPEPTPQPRNEKV